MTEPTNEAESAAHGASDTRVQHEQSAVFLDTMIYLHYQPVIDIEWHRALGIKLCFQ